MWCGRISTHTTDSVKAATIHPKTSRQSSNNNVHVPATIKGTEMERQADVMTTSPNGLYERFRRGLLEYHSEVCQLEWKRETRLMIERAGIY
jgi:hypothetical protein